MIDLLLLELIFLFPLLQQFTLCSPQITCESSSLYSVYLNLDCCLPYWEDLYHSLTLTILIIPIMLYHLQFLYHNLNTVYKSLKVMYKPLQNLFSHYIHVRFGHVIPDSSNIFHVVINFVPSWNLLLSCHQLQKPMR